jgi:outer membrane receptor protein involved in Fe transport
LDSTTFLTTKFYRVNAVALFDFPYNGTAAIGASDFSALQGGQRVGFALDGTKQLGSKNLVGFGGKYEFLRPVYSQPSAGLGLLAFTGVFGNTNDAADFFAGGYITGFMTPRTNTPCTTDAIHVCGATVSAVPLPYSDEGTHTNRQDWAFYIKDTFSPTDRLKFDFGLRLDGVNWKKPECTIQWCAPT